MIIDLFILLRKCKVIPKTSIINIFWFIITFLYLNRSGDLIYDKPFGSFAFSNLISNLLNLVPEIKKNKIVGSSR